MKKIQFIIIAILIHFCSFVDAQSNEFQVSDDLFNFYNEFNRNNADQPDNFNDIEGSPYANSDFVEGIIIRSDSIKYSGVLLRYNIYNDAMEFSRNDIAFQLPNDFPVDKIKIEEKVYVRAQYQKNNNTNTGFFQVMVEGYFSLLSKQNITFVQATENMPYKEPKPARFKNLKPEYYILKNNHTLTEIENKKDFIATIEDHKKEVEQFIKSNKIKFNKPADLQSLFNCYNLLHSQM